MTVKKVFLTGAGGFIGSHLCQSLAAEGYQVKAMVHYNSRNSWGWLEELDNLEDIEVISGDIRDFDVVYDAMKGCESVFHLAALIGIPYSYRSPLAYIRTNVEGTYNVLQSARLLNVENVLITSTSETYGTAQYVPINEEHPCVGQSPYSASKIAADQLAISYYRSFETPVKIVRPFNTFGPRQSARAIIPTVITQALSDQKSIRLGNVRPTRDWTYVQDTVRAFIEIEKSQKSTGEVINVGTGKEISIEALINLIGEIMGCSFEIQTDERRVRPENSEVERLCCDNSKIRELLNWSPSTDLRQGLEQTIDWISKNQDAFKDKIYNV
jgi:NAD dependent epimerase/dehydratase